MTPFAPSTAQAPRSTPRPRLAESCRTALGPITRKPGIKRKSFCRMAPPLAASSVLSPIRSGIPMRNTSSSGASISTTILSSGNGGASSCPMTGKAETTSRPTANTTIPAARIPTPAIRRFRASIQVICNLNERGAQRIPERPISPISAWPPIPEAPEASPPLSDATSDERTHRTLHSHSDVSLRTRRPVRPA